jgi:glycosyltransferase involved in cell wall biosynthesis
MEPIAFISVISPVYNSEKSILELVNRLNESLLVITNNFEIILVEDGGEDKSWEVISNISAKNNRVKGFKLSRNFGQHYAISCGLDHANGDYVVVMDCDLQDRPEEIVNLYKKIIEGYDVVVGRRKNRKDKFTKRLSSKFFALTLSYLIGTKVDHHVGNFGIYNKKVVNSIRNLKESIRVFSLMIQWVGFKRTSIEVEHSLRFEGSTTYNFNKLLKLALDIFLAYSDKPIRISIKIGLLISAITFFIGLYNLYLYFANKITVPGYTSIILSIWFLSGLIICSIGLIGLYVGKIFESVKNRPFYIISETI